ncbi:MAG: 8-amino-7-oxononanoate synthase, partial [Defluviicoccus sp.]
MQRLQEEFARLRRTHRQRSLELPSGIDFTSNDYLGLSSHPALARAVRDAIEETGIVGAAGSRLLRGHQPGHAALETFAAAFFGCDKALYFSSGFLANYALFTTLAGRHDAIVFDELIHASAKEGIHAAHAHRFKVRHNDLDAFASAVHRAKQAGAQQVWLAVESIYSMDGDMAPVEALIALAHAEDAMLIVDEAHATGVFGAEGRGVGDGRHGDAHVISLHTCGKALGAAGGLVCASAEVIDYLISAARPFIYSTAPPAFMALAVKRALELIGQEPWRRQDLLRLAAQARAKLAAVPGAVVPETAASQIIPVLLGTETRALAVAARLRAAGFDVRAIRPPTVPPGTA